MRLRTSKRIEDHPVNVGCEGSGSEVTTFEYDRSLNLVKKVDALSNQTVYTYNNSGDRLSETDVLGTQNYTCNSFGNVLVYEDRLGGGRTNTYSNVTSFEYDDFNRVKKVLYPAPTPGATPLSETITYDKNGNVETKVDTGGRTTSYDYDTANRLTKITDALSAPTQFTYNARSEMTKVKDALNQEYTFTYDTQGLMTMRLRFAKR